MILMLTLFAFLLPLIYFLLYQKNQNKSHQKRLEEIQKRLKEKENEKL